MRGTLTFYFDIISPFSYIAFEALLQYERQLPLKINFKPVSIGHIFKATENRPPALCPAKGLYVHSDMVLISDYWRVPFKHVTDFAGRVLGGNTTKVQRFLTATSLYQPEDLKRLIRAFWVRFYYNDKDIFTERDIIEVCNQLQIKNVENLIEKSNSAAVKQAYSEATNEAIQSGAFGVPWIVANVDGKEYKLFGTDRLHILFNICNVPFKGPLEMAKL